MAYPSRSARKPHGYLEMSRTLTYSAVLVMPLLVLYEIGIWWINRGTALAVRNAADVALKEPFLLLGSYGPHAFVILVLLGFLTIYELETKRRRVSIIRPYLGLMLVESALYALLFGAVVNLILRSLLRLLPLAPGMDGFNPLARLVLSLGAGLYEELAFRVILVSVLFVLARQWLRWPAPGAYAAAALLGAALFSAYHYLGPMGEAFEVGSFLFRFVAGLILNVIYLGRGFGIVVYTHAFYDVLVTVLRPL